LPPLNFSAVVAPLIVVNRLGLGISRVKVRVRVSVSVKVGVRVRVRVRDAQGTKRLGTNRLKYEMSGTSTNERYYCT